MAQTVANDAVEAAEIYLTAAAQSEEVRETLEYVGRVGANFIYARLRAEELERPFVEMAVDEKKRECFLRLVTIAARTQPELESVVSDMLLHYASLLSVLNLLAGKQWTVPMARAFAQLQHAVLRDLAPAFVEVTKLCDEPESIVQREVVERMTALLRQTQRVIRLSVTFESLVPNAPVRGAQTASFFTESTGALLSVVAFIARAYWYIVNALNPEAVAFLKLHFNIPYGSPAYVLLDLILKPLSGDTLARARDWYFYHQVMVQKQVTETLMTLTKLATRLAATNLLACDESTLSSLGVTKAGVRRFFTNLIPMDNEEDSSFWSTFEQWVVQPVNRWTYAGILFIVFWTSIKVLTAHVEQSVVQEVLSRASALVRGPPLLRDPGAKQYQCINGVCVRLFPGDTGEKGAPTFDTFAECERHCRLKRAPRPNLLLRGRPDTAL